MLTTGGYWRRKNQFPLRVQSQADHPHSGGWPRTLLILTALIGLSESFTNKTKAETMKLAVGGKEV